MDEKYKKFLTAPVMLEWANEALDDDELQVYTTLTSRGAAAGDLHALEGAADIIEKVLHHGGRMQYLSYLQQGKVPGEEFANVYAQHAEEWAKYAWSEQEQKETGKPLAPKEQLADMQNMSAQLEALKLWSNKLATDANTGVSGGHSTVIPTVEEYQAGGGRWLGHAADSALGWLAHGVEKALSSISPGSMFIQDALRKEPELRDLGEAYDVYTRRQYGDEPSFFERNRALYSFFLTAQKSNQALGQLQTPPGWFEGVVGSTISLGIDYPVFAAIEAATEGLGTPAVVARAGRSLKNAKRLYKLYKLGKVARVSGRLLAGAAREAVVFGGYEGLRAAAREFSLTADTRELLVNTRTAAGHGAVTGAALGTWHVLPVHGWLAARAAYAPHVAQKLLASSVRIGADAAVMSATSAVTDPNHTTSFHDFASNFAVFSIMALGHKALGTYGTFRPKVEDRLVDPVLADTVRMTREQLKKQLLQQMLPHERKAAEDGKIDLDKLVTEEIAWAAVQTMADMYSSVDPKDNGDSLNVHVALIRAITGEGELDPFTLDGANRKAALEALGYTVSEDGQVSLNLGLPTAAARYRLTLDIARDFLRSRYGDRVFSHPEEVRDALGQADMRELLTAVHNAFVRDQGRMPDELRELAASEGKAVQKLLDAMSDELDPKTVESLKRFVSDPLGFTFSESINVLKALTDAEFSRTAGLTASYFGLGNVLLSRSAHGSEVANVTMAMLRVLHQAAAGNEELAAQVSALHTNLALGRYTDARNIAEAMPDEVRDAARWLASNMHVAREHVVAGLLLHEVASSALHHANAVQLIISGHRPSARADELRNELSRIAGDTAPEGTYDLLEAVIKLDDAVNLPEAGEGRTDVDVLRTVVERLRAEGVTVKDEAVSLVKGVLDATDTKLVFTPHEIEEAMRRTYGDEVMRAYGVAKEARRTAWQETRLARSTDDVHVHKRHKAAQEAYRQALHDLGVAVIRRVVDKALPRLVGEVDFTSARGEELFTKAVSSVISTIETVTKRHRHMQLPVEHPLVFAITELERNGGGRIHDPFATVKRDAAFIAQLYTKARTWQATVRTSTGTTVPRIGEVLDAIRTVVKEHAVKNHLVSVSAEVHKAIDDADLQIKNYANIPAEERTLAQEAVVQGAIARVAAASQMLLGLEKDAAERLRKALNSPVLSMLREWAKLNKEEITRRAEQALQTVDEATANAVLHNTRPAPATPTTENALNVLAEAQHGAGTKLPSRAAQETSSPVEKASMEQARSAARAVKKGALPRYGVIRSASDLEAAHFSVREPDLERGVTVVGLVGGEPEFASTEFVKRRHAAEEVVSALRRLKREGHKPKILLYLHPNEVKMIERLHDPEADKGTLEPGTVGGEVALILHADPEFAAYTDYAFITDFDGVDDGLYTGLGALVGNTHLVLTAGLEGKYEREAAVRDKLNHLLSADLGKEERHYTEKGRKTREGRKREAKAKNTATLRGYEHLGPYSTVTADRILQAFAKAARGGKEDKGKEGKKEPAPTEPGPSNEVVNPGTTLDVEALVRKSRKEDC